jgi:tetratricopeptide (TPR) repeat protein
LANRSPAFAADLVAAALVQDVSTEEIDDAARFLLGSGRSSLDRRLAHRVLGNNLKNDEAAPARAGQQQAVREQIRSLKRDVRGAPRTALLWSELARRYASLGQRDKADNAMHVALALAPEHRFVLRSAARLSVHLGDPERAHSLLSEAQSVRRDPWLLAAEIAIAPLAGRRSKLLKQGRRFLESAQFHPTSVSELASALATEAFMAGSARDARRLFVSSLASPTENAVAQAAWASRHGARVVVADELIEAVEGSFEARAQMLATSGDSQGAIENAWAWLAGESFAALPAVFGSHEAAIAQDYAEAIRFAQFGLVANPDDFFLRNNLAFALASCGDVDGSREQLKHIRPSDLEEGERVFLDATTGLIAFRSGELETGRTLYRQAIRNARDPATKAIAAIVLAREEILARTTVGEETFTLAKELADAARRTSDPGAERIPDWLSHIETARVGNATT